MIGIIGAMDIEIEHIVSYMDNKKEEVISGVTFTVGKIAGKDVVTAVCGIGKVFSAMCAQTMILRFSPEVIINTGVAGTLCREAGIMDTVVATDLVQHDMDTTHFGDPRGMISGINIVNFPTDEKLTNSVCQNIDGNYIKGTIASGDIFVADENKKRDIAETFGALACEMEGASIAHVCYVNKTPVCVVRTISDGADSGGVMNYETFREKAAEKSSNIIINTIKNI